MGPITIVADGEAITGLYFQHHIRRPDDAAFGVAMPVSEDPLLRDAVQQLLEYLDGRREGFDLPLRAAGDDFNHAVWDVVARIPAGQTTTYGAIAEQLGDRSLAQKVGQAVGANPLCIFVPCHRVVGSNGSLTGYAGGLTRKRVLLELEEPATASAERLF
nr:methylated-DNA--[protein]-cysteine S-methyltransferase [Planotetraspora thailandica]